MAKKVNKNFLGGLTAVAFLLMTVLGVFMIYRLQPRDPAEYVRKAEAAAAASNWDQAKTYYAKAYQVSDPKDASFLVRAGEMSFAAGKETDAMAYWNEAKVQDPLQVEARTKMLNYFVEMSRYQPMSAASWTNVRKEAEELLAIEPANVLGRYCRGLALVRLKGDAPDNLNQGVQALEEVVAADPENVDYGLSLADAYLTRSRDLTSEKVDATTIAKALVPLKMAEQVLRNMVQRHSESGEKAAQARSRLAGFLDDYARLLKYWGREPSLQEKLQDEAIQLFTEATSKAGGDKVAMSEAKAALGMAWARRWQAARASTPDSAETTEYFNKARDEFKGAVELDADTLEAYRALASIYAENAMFEEAVQVCQARLDRPILRTGMKAVQQKLLRFLLLLQAGESSLEKANTLKKEDPVREEWLAKSLRYLDDAEAEQRGDALATHLRGRVMLARGQSLESLRLLNEAEPVFQAVDITMPLYGPARLLNLYLLAGLQIENNRPGKAVESAEQGIQLAPKNPNFWGLLAAARVAINDNERAIQIAEQALAMDPNQAVAKKALLDAHRNLGHTDKVKELMAQGGGDTVSDKLREAQILNLEGKPKDALEVLLPLVAKEPANPDIVRSVAALYVQMGDNAKAHEITTAALKLDPENLRLKAFNLSTDPTISADEREKRQFALADELEDPFSRAMQKAVWFLNKKNESEALKYLNESQQLIVTKGSPAAISHGPRLLGSILDTKFIIAGKKNDWTDIERSVETAKEFNVDGAGGLSYEGLLHMFKAMSIKGEDRPSAEQRREQWNLAANAFREVRKVQPGDAKNLVRLSQSFFALEQWTDAREAIDAALRVNPRDFDAQKTAAVLGARTNDTQSYKEHLKIAKELNPRDPWILGAIQDLEEIDDPAKGVARREKLRQEKPDDLGNLIKLADLYEKLNTPNEARGVYEQALALAPTDRGLVRAASNFFRKNGDNAEGLKILETYVDAQKTREEKAEALLLVGAHYRQVGDMESADATFAKALDAAKTLRVLMGVAYHYYDTGRFEKALEWQQQALTVAETGDTGQGPALRRMAVDILLKLNQKDKALVAIDEYQAKYPNDPNTSLLRGQVEFARGHIEDAVGAMNKYLQDKPNDSQALFQRAEFQLSQGRWAAAIQDLERIRAENPNFMNFAARLRLADAYDLSGQSDKATSELQTILNENPEALDVARKLVELDFRRQRFAEAQKNLTGLISRFPDQPEWYAYRARAAAAVGNKPVAVGDGRKAVELGKFAPGYVNGLLDLFQEYSMLDEGILFFEGTLKDEHRIPTTRFRYANLLAAKSDYPKAVEQYRLSLSDLAQLDFNDIRRMFADIFRIIPEKREMELFKEAPADPVIKRSNDLILAGLHSFYSETPQAIAILEQLLPGATTDGEKVILLSLLGDGYSDQKRYDDARQAYEQVLALDQNSWAAMNNLAYLLDEELGKSAEALPYAQKAAVLVTRLGILGGVGTVERASVYDTLGSVYMRLGQLDDAIGEFSRGIQTDPRVIPNYLHLGEAYRRRGDFDRARQIIDQGLQVLKNRGVGPDDDDVKALEAVKQKAANMQRD